MSEGNRIKAFYNEYGIKEWERLEQSPYDHLNYLLHVDFVKDYLKTEAKILDAGCGAGRFSIAFAKDVKMVDLLDISEEQVRIAKEKFSEYKQESKLGNVFVGNLADMTEIPDNTYDLTVCYGAPLNYLWDNYQEGINELYRVTKKGGHIVASVNSRLGVFRFLFGNEGFDIAGFMSKPDYWHVNQVLVTGDLPEHPEVAHPPRHFFSGEELKKCFELAGFVNTELASSPAIISGMRSAAESIYKDEVAFETLFSMEVASYKNLHLIDSGEFLMIRGEK